MDGNALKVGNKFIIKDSKKMAKYHGFKEGEIVTLEETIKPDLKDRAYRFKNDKDFNQDLFLRDVQPYKVTGE